MEGVEKLKDTYATMCLEGDRWSGHLVHSDFLLNFAPDDLSDQGNPSCCRGKPTFNTTSKICTISSV